MTLSNPHRIDIHHHFCPPPYAAAARRHAFIFPNLNSWTPAQSIEDMDRASVATSMLSITTPGLWFGDNAEARHLARVCNDYAARLVVDHPGRFGFFAALPLPDIDGSLREIEYAFDVLKADGIGLYTSYNDKHLGDPSFGPILEELNRRMAVAYTHPICPDCCKNLLPGIPEVTIEFGTDTTRTIASLVFSGAATRYVDIEFIFSHAGGTLPFLVERFLLLAQAPDYAAKLPKGVLHELQKFHYDTAQASNPGAMSSLMKLVSVSQVLYGTDFPFRTCEEHVKGLRQCGFSEAELRAIERDNALALLPGLKVSRA
jgi:predicted TIM-barrel fold metal-dependent hydrolase